MQVQFRSDQLARLEAPGAGSGGFPSEVARAYRKKLFVIRGVTDERDLYAYRQLRFEKLKGDRAHQHSMRLNDQWRLVVEVRKADPKNIIFVVGIEDYH